MSAEPRDPASTRVAWEMLMVLAGLTALGGAWRALDWARGRSDPRRAVVSQVRREAGARDLIVLTDEAPELVALASPVAAVWGSVALDDLHGVRRLYGIAPAEAQLATLIGRFGPGAVLGPGARARRWDLPAEHTGRVVFDVATALSDRVTAHRDGGEDAGPCPFANGRLVCHGPDWNQLRVETHRFDGGDMACLYAHPHPDGTLVVELNGVPPARALVGAFGIDDAGYFPAGTDVTLALVWRAEGHPEATHTLVARNRKGVTGYRFEVPHAAARATLTISTPNAGARQFCFTLRATE